MLSSFSIPKILSNVVIGNFLDLLILATTTPDFSVCISNHGPFSGITLKEYLNSFLAKNIPYDLMICEMITLSTPLMIYEADGVISGKIPIFARLLNNVFSVFFFPSSKNHSLRNVRKDTSHQVQRTAALNEVKRFTEGESQYESIVLVTYPHAVSELIIDIKSLKSNILKISKEERIERR